MSDRIPIRDDELIFLRGPREFDPIALNGAVSPLGFESYTAKTLNVVEEQLKKLLVEKGISYAWQRLRVFETVLPATTALNIPPLLAVLQSMVGKLNARQDFIIVDRFLLPNNPPSDYVANLMSILGSVIDEVQRVTLVTAAKYNAQLFHNIEKKFVSRNARCQLMHQTSDTFHDRFWIADRTAGLFVGTSLNGIGRRYALVDYMRQDDVKEIVGALQTENLL